MLSSGQYHLLVPRDPEENLKFRLWILDECRRNKRTRELVWRACRDDILFFINAFAWQTNPNNLDSEDGPFVTFPVQDECILFTIQKLLHERRLVLWEKSRMQGGTVMALLIDIWLCLFHRRKRSLVMSHNKDAVERSGDEDTLFGKIDFILEHLPSWMLDGLPRVKSVYQFKKTKSQIAGVATTLRSGVGGRASKITLDEFSKYRDASAILGQTRDTGPALVIGTHYGVGGEFYDLCRRPDVAKFVLHWSRCPLYNRGLYRSDPGLQPNERVVDHASAPPPDYNFVTDGTPLGGPFPGLRSPYYDAICRDRNAREVAIHWDIDPTGAASNYFDHNMLRDLIVRYCRPPEWVGEIEYDPAGRPTALRESESGPLRIWGRLLPDHARSKRWLSPSIYKVGGDIGAGVGKTPTCFAGGDSMTGKKVLEYQQAWIPPERIAVVAVALCHLLKDPAGNPAQIVWDATGPTGEKFGQTILELGFRQVWYWRDEFRLNQKVSDKAGWFDNPTSKMALLSNYEQALKNGHLLNPSENALKECLAFEYVKGGKIVHGESVRTEDPAGGTVNHSDLAIADALMWKLMKEAGSAKPATERQQSEAPAFMTIGWLLSTGEETRDPFRR